MTQLTKKISSAFNKARHMDKVDLSIKAGVDTVGALTGAFAASALMLVGGIASAPVSIPLAVGAAALGGILTHKSRFGTSEPKI